MNNFNVVGFLGKDPRFNDARTTCDFSVGTDSTYFDKNAQKWKKMTRWVPIIAFNGKAKLCEYLKKGSRVSISGYISQDKWQMKDGTVRYNTNLIADAIELLDTKAQQVEREEKQNEGFLNIPAGLEAESMPFN